MTEASSTYEKLNKEQMERNCHVLAEVKKLRLAAGLKESAGILVESDVGYNNPPKGRHTQEDAVIEVRRRKGLPTGPGSLDGCTQTFDRNLKMGNSEGKMAKKNAEAVIRPSGVPIEDLCGDNDDILEQKIKLSGYTISEYSREEMETAIGNIPIEVRSRHNARYHRLSPRIATIFKQYRYSVTNMERRYRVYRATFLLGVDPGNYMMDRVTKSTQADNVLLKRGAEGHLAVKLIDFGSACHECYPCSFDVREEMSSHIAPEICTKQKPDIFHATKCATTHYRTKYIQHTSKEDEMEDITTMEKTEQIASIPSRVDTIRIGDLLGRSKAWSKAEETKSTLPTTHQEQEDLNRHDMNFLDRKDVEVEQLLDQWMKGTSAHRRIHPMMDGWEAFQRDMAILAFFERPISMCVLSGWMGGLPEGHGHPGLLRATHQYVCLVMMDGRPSRETWPSWPSSSDPSICVSCQDGWEAFQRDMAVLAFFESPISMCVSGWMGGLPERHGHPGLL
ncbi:hypothetical protein Bbelb_317750 [Branchiostoma belcheri]|nr:hypothetical protein Bbelb_317750 [Branchiostoma belcheri]